MSTLLNTIIDIVKEGGKILTDAQVESEQITDKEGAGNIVTIYDKKTQEYLQKCLQEALPEAIFVGEEEENHKKVAEKG